MNTQEQNKKSRCSDDHIKITGWEIVDINRKLNIFNFLLIILIVLEVFQIFLRWLYQILQSTEQIKGGNEMRKLKAIKIALLIVILAEEIKSAVKKIHYNEFITYKPKKRRVIKLDKVQ